MLTPQSWLQQLWHSISKYSIKLTKLHSKIPLPWENDVALMDAVIQAKFFSRDEVECINRCRLYMKVFFLSDIVSGNGKLILQEVYEGREIKDRTSRWQWPRQSRPRKKHWLLWDIALKELWARTETRCLLQCLGNWIHESHQDYKFVYDLNDNTIIESFTNGRKIVYRNTPVRTRQSNFYTAGDPIQHIPSTCIPISVHKPSANIIYGEPDMQSINKITETTTSSWNSYIISLHPEIQYLLAHANITNNGLDIARAIRGRTAIAVSDASVKKSSNKAAISWIITNKEETFQAHGDSGCPSFHQALDSYASESFGILVMLTVVKIVRAYYKIRHGCITVACDNASSLEKCTRNNYRANATEKYIDLFWAVYDIRKSLPITIRHKYVAGHQDGKKRVLNIYERLNVACDNRSKSFRKCLESGQLNHVPVCYGDNNWNMLLGKIRISAKFKESIQDHILGTKLINKMITRNDISSEAVSHIDWTMMGGASKYQSSGDRLWLSKFVSGFVAMAVQMKYRDQKKKSESQETCDNDYTRWKCDLCPICKSERENQYHVIICPSKRSKRCRKKTLTTLSQWFDQQHTDPFITQCVINVLSEDGKLSFYDAMMRLTDNDAHLDAAKSQDLIGFHNFQFDRISRLWKFVQEDYLIRRYNGKRYSYEAWTKRFIYQLYQRLRVIWRKRCEIVHGSVGKAVSKRKRKAVREDIKLQ